MCTADNKPAALPLAPLPCLPEGLCLAVIEQCDMSCKIALSQANRRFHRLIDPYDKSQRPQMKNFLIEAQSFPRHQKEDGFAGFACTKILPRALNERQRSSDWRWQRAQNGTIARTIYEHSGNENADFPPKATKGGPREVQPIQKRVFE
jgi:hypothetical protein